LLRRLRLWQKKSAWAFGSPAGGRHVAECLGRWRALPLRGPARRFYSPDRFSSIPNTSEEKDATHKRQIKKKSI
jgi:hypothetical protein